MTKKDVQIRLEADGLKHKKDFVLYNQGDQCVVGLIAGVEWSFSGPSWEAAYTEAKNHRWEN